MKQRFSDKAVVAKTGKNWKAWFTILDKAGVKKMDHRSIALFVNSHYPIGDWWSQMVTVEYEKARGLRKKHQKASGYEISASKTLEFPVKAVSNWFSKDRSRNLWMGGKTRIRTSTPKSMRLDWTGGEVLSINFYAKGLSRTQVTVQHSKIKDQKSAIKLKSMWKTKLEKLFGRISRNRPGI